jgi:hypothetical protein
MARSRNLDGVAIRATGLRELSRTLRSFSDGSVNRRWKATIRKAVGPITSEAKQRFRSLPGTGRRVARTVRAGSTATAVSISFGSKRHPYSFGREFGAKRLATRPHSRRYHLKDGSTITKTNIVAHTNFRANSMFGEWTGNRYTLGKGQTSGRAMLPAISHGLTRLRADLEKSLDGYLTELAKAVETK